MFTGIIIITAIMLAAVGLSMFATDIGPRTISFPTGGTKTGRPVRVSADGWPEYKSGGLKIDWGTVVAVSGSAVTLPDDTVVGIGFKYLRYGQVMVRNIIKEQQTVTITGTPTGGTFTLSLTRNGVTKQTAAIAYNATAAQVQSALEALDNVAVGDVTVTGGPGPGTPYVVTFNVSEDVAQMTTTAAFTGGSSPAVAVTTTTAGTTAPQLGMFRPATNSDTLVNGDTFILNATILEGSGSPADDPITQYAAGAFDGGKVFQSRLLVGGAGQPTLANLLAACPRLKLVND